MLAAQATRRLGLTAHATFSGALLWPYVYPWPQRPAGLVETGFAELAERWRPILDAFDEVGVDVCYEIHPGEDLHDGVTFETVPRRGRRPPRASILYDPSHFVLQQLDYLGVHRPLPRAHQGVPRQGRRVQPERPRRRLWRLPALDRSRRPLPLARRRPDRFPRDLLASFAPVRLRRLGGARVGMRAEASRGRRARGRGVHPRPHRSA